MLCSPQAAHEIQEAEFPYQRGGLEDDATVHFGDPGATVHEHDRDLLDPESTLPAAKRHLDLESVPLGADPVERNALERAPAEALETPGRVGERHAGDEARVHVRAVREDEPRQRPVDDGDAVQVARAQHDVGILRGLEELADGVGVVREVGVHLEHELGAVRERVAEPVPVRRAESELPRAPDQVDARRLRLPRLHESRGPVGRAVVHHQHVQSVREPQQALQQRIDVVTLVVGGDDHRLLHQGAAPWAGSASGAYTGARRESHHPAPTSSRATPALASDSQNPTWNVRDSYRNTTLCRPSGTATARSRWSARRRVAARPSTVTFHSGYQRSASRRTAGRAASTSTSTSCSLYFVIVAFPAGRAGPGGIPGSFVSHV